MQPMTLGVEEEFLLIDAHTGALVPRSPAILDRAVPILGDRVQPELNECQIEVASLVATDLDELGADLRYLRSSLAQTTGEMHTAIAPLGTHPFSSWRDQRVNSSLDRYRDMEDAYQVVARQQVICGCHVHIGFDDADMAVAVMNRSRTWLPVLLALSANSPFWSGSDSGFASYRTQVWQRWPTSGMPPTLRDRAEYDAVVQELASIEAIEDATFMYWYVRPSDRYPTLEFRVCDVCLDVEDTITIAGLVRALAWTSARDEAEGVAMSPRSREALDAAMWHAGRYGIESTLIDPLLPLTRPAGEVVDVFLDHVADGLDAHGDREQVVDGVRRIFARGNGAMQQRAAAAVGTPWGVIQELFAAQVAR
jgi:carboxylate-amine ligase